MTHVLQHLDAFDRLLWRTPVGYFFEINDKGTTIKQLAPGLDIDHVSLSFQDSKLSLIIKPTEEQRKVWEGTGVDALFGSYSYLIPHEVDSTKIKAKLSKGILEIFLPVGKSGKQIKIETS